MWLPWSNAPFIDAGAILLWFRIAVKLCSPDCGGRKVSLWNVRPT